MWVASSDKPARGKGLPAGSSRRQGTGPDARPATILLVEDDPIIAMAVGDDLAASGYRILGPADNGRDAIALAEAHGPDLVVMDVRLRGRMTGIEAAREIKARIATRLVFATAFLDSAAREAMAKVGYEALLPKPYTPEQLAATIAGALETRGKDS